MPEEHNRVAVDRLSSLLLCSDEKTAERARMTATGGDVVVTGDVMADAVRLFAPTHDRIRNKVVLTIHREANIPRLPEIMDAVGRIDARVVFPAHPRARAALNGNVPNNVTGFKPQSYSNMLGMVRSATCLITDSGGLQKEAYWLGTPCVTVRPSTEWTATVDAGANVLVEPEGIPDAVAKSHFPADAPQLYGDGYAAERIVEALLA
jgi:UDP-N-acetylglucosamine 2-epimerase